MIRDLVSAGINHSGAADKDLCSYDFNQLKDADIIIALNTSRLLVSQCESKTGH